MPPAAEQLRTLQGSGLSAAACVLSENVREYVREPTVLISKRVRGIQSCKPDV